MLRWSLALNLERAAEEVQAQQSPKPELAQDHKTEPGPDGQLPVSFWLLKCGWFFHGFPGLFVLCVGMGHSSYAPGLPLAGAGMGSESFPTTHWSTVLMASQGTSQAETALARLCQAYWYPLYVFVRRQGRAPEDAQDLVQGFFARLVEKDYLKAADQGKGKFRSFLLLAFKRFSANEWDRARRLKRGGGAEIVSLDAATESRYLAEPVDDLSPEKAYERQWALTLIEQAVQRLEVEYASAGKAAFFGELSICVSGEKPTDSYAEIGRRLGTTEGTVKVMVHQLRQRYRQLLRDEIANTVANPEEVEEEIRHLFTVLG